MPDLNLLSQSSKILRGPMDKLREAPALANTALVNRAIAFADQDNDIGILKDMGQARFARGIDKQVDVDGNETGNEVYTGGGYSYGGYTTYERSAERLKIDQGFYPIINTGLFTQITKARSTLFTQSDQHWDYFQTDIDEATGQPLKAEDVAAAMADIRERGNFLLAAETVDFVSAAVETAALHIYFYGFRLWYDPVLPTDMYVVFGEYIKETDDQNNKVKRPVNQLNIEDASVIVIKAGEIQPAAGDGNTKTQNRWMAYIGANETHELGRFVTYAQNNYWPVPDPDKNNPDIIDYYHGSEMCNPLTYVKNRGESLKELSSKEYPVVLFRGGTRKIAKTLMPLSTSLYESCIEIEMGWSRLLHACNESATGINVITLGTGDPAIPRSLKLPIMRANSQFQHIDTNSGLEQSQVIQIIAGAVAAGRSVPSYMVNGSIESTPESGVKLAIMTAPLINERVHRQKINQDGVSEIWEVEKGLIGEYRGPGASKLLGITQTWDPGTWSPPRDETTRTTEILADRDGELIDHVESVRRKHRLETDKDAEDLIAKYTERDPDYGGTVPPEPGAGLVPPALQEINAEDLEEDGEMEDEDEQG